MLGPNLVIDPAFTDTDIHRNEWWASGGWPWANGDGYSTDHLRPGTEHSIKLTSVEGGWQGFALLAESMMPSLHGSIASIPVKAGQRYYIEMWVYPLEQRGHLDAGIAFHDTSGAEHPVYWDTIGLGSGEFAPIPTPPANTWTKISGYHTIPAGYDRAEVYFEHLDDADGLVVYVSSPRVSLDVFVPDNTLPGSESPIVTDAQVISLHTATGSLLHQWLPDGYADCTWGRQLRDASRLSLAVPPVPDVDTMPEFVPWLHWLSCWDAERDVLLWTGPVQKVTANRRGVQLEAKDSGAYLSRLRNPITKRWDAADPAHIAGELWRGLIEQQNLNVRPIVRPDPEGERFDYQVIVDDQMLDQTIGDLVNIGLRWTVVSGVPLIGVMSLEPVATLGEDDFLGDGISFVRDGSATYNDVLVRGPDNLARAKVDFYGQNLQTIANVDSMFGVSNVTRAAQAYVKHTGSVRTTLDLGNATSLHPAAPVHIDELMPGARFVIEAQGLRQLMMLTAVEVARRAGSRDVKVTMEQVEEKLELAKDKTAPTVTLGKAAAL